MNLENVIDFCLSNRGAFKDYPFGPEPLVVKVGSKMFAILSENNGLVSISLKCDPILAQNLRAQYTSVKPGYHLNKEHWNTVTVDGSIPDDELVWMITHSYSLVLKSLSRKEKQKIIG